MIVTIREALSAILLGWGVLLFLSPFLLYWFIHGSQERYIWLISGPPPFNSFGGGPFQIYLYVGLVLLGLVFVSAGLLIRGWRHRETIALREARRRAR